jgi:GNAT superfamily N-acetyltransferase
MGQKIRELQEADAELLNVLPPFGRQGIASQLLEQAEAIVAERGDRVGIGVGFHPGYNMAQRMYVLRGYVPDARGVSWKGNYIEERQQIVADDELVLHLVKALRDSS